MPEKINKNSLPRVKIIQKIYNLLLNPDTQIDYPKSQYKKFIKDVVEGTMERSEFIETTITKHLNSDINFKKKGNCDKKTRTKLFKLFAMNSIIASRYTKLHYTHSLCEKSFALSLTLRDNGKIYAIRRHHGNTIRSYLNGIKK